MPLHIDAISEATGKGPLLRWLLDTDEVKKQQVGRIDLRGRMAVIEVPDAAARRLASRLDGTRLDGRVVQVWHTSDDTSASPPDHFQQLTRWLDMEARAETEQAEAWAQGPADQDSSTSLTGLVIRETDTGLGGLPMLTLGRPSRMHALPPTRLNVGAPVLIKSLASNKPGGTRGVISAIDRLSISVLLTQFADIEDDDQRFRIVPSTDEISTRRCRTALAKAAHAEGRLAELRDVLLGDRDPQFAPPTSPRFLDDALNDSQRDAITFALSAEDVAIIHGPPGTGKTTTLVELIRQAVQRGDRVMACAPSNLGVDNLLERLLEQHVSVVRIGHPIRVLEHLREHALDAMVRSHPDMRRARKLRRQAYALFRNADRTTRAPVSRDERRALRDEAKALLDDARREEEGVVQLILNDASVICSTLTAVDAQLLGTMRFDTLVIDEACQCAEPACWIPLTRANRVIFAGDHCQLPPTIISQRAAREGFAVSMQERLVDLYGERLAKPLLVQYRMHEEIMMFSSDEFYETKLLADPSVAAHRLCDLDGVEENELTTTAIHFIDTSGASYEEEREKAGTSWMNREEAALAARKASHLLASGVVPGDIAVITPYVAQVAVLRELMEDTLVEVGSIDGFQGREKEAVIISMVRSNKEREIGFLIDFRRINVALTRARRKLIVIGDSSTISSHPFYERLLAHFDLVEGYHVVWEEL